MAVSSAPTRMRWPFAFARRVALAEALVDRLDDLFEGEPGLQVLLGGVAHLGVDDAVRGQVLGALGGDPDQRLAGLHDGAGVREGLQVALQRARVGGLAEPYPQLLGVGLGEAVVAGLAGQLDDRGGTQAAVEMVVEEHLRGATDLFGRGNGPGEVGGLARHFGTVAPTRVDRAERYGTVTRRRGGQRASFCHRCLPWFSKRCRSRSQRNHRVRWGHRDP
ncbi:hypothetical protein GCM10020221_08730 [Streptomyces thioluteus]|uniref:Uncharacterized protein n=1 Tax=Streptomyces thioluteus TaxID=66431 RepID=A0ABN3WGH4_STRTU